MSTVIRFKRKKLTGNDNVDLLAGEPYFNLNDKHFYICEEDGSFPDKHVAEVTTVTVSDATVKFYVGGDTNNLYEKTINNVANAMTADKLSSSNIGSSTQPVYFTDGKPVVCDNSIDKATTTKLGLVKVGYEKPSTETRNYQPVRMSDDGKLYVEITGEISGTITSAKDAQNVTEKIKDVLITDIFESDGITVQKSSTATKLGTSAGSSIKPIYFEYGKPVKCSYELKKTVPEDAIFTDTTYSVADSTTLGLVKVGYTKNGSKLPVELENDQMFVDTTSTVTKIEELEEQLTWGTF